MNKTTGTGATIYVDTDLKWAIKQQAAKERTPIKEFVARVFNVYRALSPAEIARLLDGQQGAQQ